MAPLGDTDDVEQEETSNSNTGKVAVGPARVEVVTQGTNMSGPQREYSRPTRSQFRDTEFL